MSGTKPETQKECAEWVTDEMHYYAVPMAQCHEYLKELLERAQNEPPHGESDRTISPTEFGRLREIENAMARFRRALENAWKSGEGATPDRDDWQFP